jgi:hypothetical protein
MGIGTRAALVTLTLASPGLTDELRCTTTENKILQRLETLCFDGTRAISYGNRTLERWETTVQPVPGIWPSSTTRMHPQMTHVNVRYR